MGVAIEACDAVGNSSGTIRRPLDAMTDRPALLLLGQLPPATLASAAASFDITHLPHDASAFLRAQGARFELAATDSVTGAGPEVLQSLPRLRLLACFGVGTERVAFDVTRSRGIHVTNTPDVLTDDVADLAIALLLAAARRVCEGERYVRAGRWTGGPLSLGVTLRGKRLGILGLGRIGHAVARRAEIFGLSVSYTARRPKESLPYRFVPSVCELAGACDFLIVCASGGQSTEGIVGAAVLAALGPRGVLVNVSRGSLVDETALYLALKEQRLGAAALDVFASEPCTGQPWVELENIVVTPHIGSATVETRAAMGQVVLDNLRAFVAGRPLVSVVV